MSRGGSGRSVTLSATEQQRCVQADKAVGLEFAGVDIIREYGKAPNFYITEMNGNPGTGIIDITGYNYFVDLVQHLESKRGQAAQAPSNQTTTAPGGTEGEEARTYPAEYVTLTLMEQNGERMSATQSGLLAFYRLRHGRIKV